MAEWLAHQPNDKFAIEQLSSILKLAMSRKKLFRKRLKAKLVKLQISQDWWKNFVFDSAAVKYDDLEYLTAKWYCAYTLYGNEKFCQTVLGVVADGPQVDEFIRILKDDYRMTVWTPEQHQAHHRQLQRLEETDVEDESEESESEVE